MLLRATQSSSNEGWELDMIKLPRAITTQHNWSRTEFYGLKSLLKMQICNRRGLALARHEEAKHQGRRTVTRIVPREQWHNGSCQRAVGNFQKSITCWFVLVLGLCSLLAFFFFFFLSETGLGILFSIFILANGRLASHSSYMTPKEPPNSPWKIYQTF